MKKLTLDLHGLQVDSFATAEPPVATGTVEAFAEGWSDDSVCPTTVTTECKRCPFPR